MIKRCIYIMLLSSLAFSCDLAESPRSLPSPKKVFSSKIGLEKYVRSFYNILPTPGDITRAGKLSDYAARNVTVSPLLNGTLNPRTVKRWSWNKLRNINYFLQHNNSSSVPEKVRDNYNGIARFFRAWFYFKKVKRYGKVPWISKPLKINSGNLKPSRDPRTLVMDSVLADINYAIANISEIKEPSRTKITRDVALALKSRICLFEGTYRYYHHELGLEATAVKWLKATVKASKRIMESGVYHVYRGAGIHQSYRKLFISKKPIASSVILALAFSNKLNVQHNANFWYTSAQYGVGLSFIQQFINTFLMRNGEPFTDQKGYKTMTFRQEVKDRDTRLEQMIRMPTHTRIGKEGKEVPAPPDFSYTHTGYQPIKWTIPNAALDARTDNDNAISIFRYGEILLNYAEAKAILGTITNQDWNKTVGALRRRAGITGGTTMLPTKVDPYLQKSYFPNISNPVILEIRRCRGIELALEGLRFEDLKRWDVGELMEMKWKGIYVHSVNSYMDIGGNSKPDVYFYKDKKPEKLVEGVHYVRVGTANITLTNGTSGHLVVLPNVKRKWSQKKYYYPINIKDLQKNPNLKQNPGW